MPKGKFVGKKLKLTAFDGYATYEVTEDDGEFCTLVHVPDEFGYQAPLLAGGCKISHENVRASVEWAKRWGVNK